MDDQKQLEWNKRRNVGCRDGNGPPFRALSFAVTGRMNARAVDSRNQETKEKRRPLRTSCNLILAHSPFSVEQCQQTEAATGVEWESSRSRKPVCALPSDNQNSAPATAVIWEERQEHTVSPRWAEGDADGAQRGSSTRGTTVLKRKLGCGYCDGFLENFSPHNAYSGHSLNAGCT